MFAGFTLLIIVIVAVAVFAVVAIAAGQLHVKDERVERFAKQTNERLNAKGDVPQFLRRLDEH